MRKWYRWERVRTTRIEVSCVVGLAERDAIAQIARRCEEALDQITVLLGVRPINRRISVFLYPDLDSFRRCELIQGTLFEAGAGPNYISLPYKPWDQIAATVVHELTHIAVQHRITRNSLLLLDEGLAMYAPAELHPRATRPPGICLSEPLQTLADGSSLRDCMVTPLLCSDAYDHVHAFALYLIHHYGINRFMELIRCSAHRNKDKRTRRFGPAVQKIYGVTVDQLEQRWRQDCAMTRDGWMLCWDWVLPDARRAIEAARQYAQEQGSSSVEPHHLLRAALQRHESVATQLIAPLAPVCDVLQCLENLPVCEAPEEPLSWALATRQCIALAINEASCLGRTYIGTEHFVLGVLRQELNPACHILNEFGIELESLRTAARERYRTTKRNRQSHLTTARE
jgi:hypothetical protein